MNTDKLSFYNMVIFNETALNKIINEDVYASDVLTSLVRMNLSKLGILVFIRHQYIYLGDATRTLYPSCLARMILDGLLDVQDFME